jgi:hypothetical protein
MGARAAVDARAGRVVRTVGSLVLALAGACADAVQPAGAGDAGEQAHDASGGDAGSHDAGAQGMSSEDAAVNMPVDPCANVPASGVCSSDDSYMRCIRTTGTGVKQVVTFDCHDGERCDDSGEFALCKPWVDCREGSTRCIDEATLETCTSHQLVASSCATDCVDSPLGAFCAAELATHSLAGTLHYDRVAPTEELDGWSDTPSQVAGAGFAVLSFHGDTLLDAAITSSGPLDRGSFAIRVADELGDDDRLVVVAAGSRGDSGPTYAVADPGFPASHSVRGALSTPPDPRMWSWSFALTAPATSAELSIAREDGSGAAFAFDVLRRVTELTDGHYQPEEPASVLVWLGIGVAWDCGACMTNAPIDMFEAKFASQLWIDGSDDEGYWSDPVTAHELGHYVMTSFGYAPSEGGAHYLGTKTNPGQAWSEGWATFFSSMLRDSPRYYDKQAGAFVWWDIDLRSYLDGGLAWPRAEAAQGLEQLIDENEVAGLLWDTYVALDDTTPVLDALASPRMTVAPFARGYTERSWNDPEHPENYTESDLPLPYLADYFDALRCADALSAAELDAVTEPATRYPYPSGAPLCD